MGLVNDDIQAEAVWVASETMNAAFRTLEVSQAGFTDLYPWVIQHFGQFSRAIASFCKVHITFRLPNVLI